MRRAGDLDPELAYRVLAEDPDAFLVDVRTRAEWVYVGLPDLSALDKDVVGVEWVRYPDGAPSEAFLHGLCLAGVRPERPVLFIGRSGVRSGAARAGYARTYNVSDGFEGPLDADSHRGVRGWKAAGLPWRQS